MRSPWAFLAVVLGAGLALAQPAPDAELRKEAGNYYLKKRQYEQARDEYLAALKIEPDYADAHYNLGVVYFFRLQDHRRALHHFVRYARLKPDAPDLSQVRSLTLQALEKIEAEERVAYGRALEQGTSEAVEAFLATYPDSLYAPDAQTKLRALTGSREQTLRRDSDRDTAYMEALARGTPEALDDFLTAHPDAPQAPEVLQLRARWLQRRTEESKELEDALSVNTPEALEAFLAARPGSPLAPRAQAALERLRASEKAYRIASEARSIPALEVFLATYAGTPRQADAAELLRELREAESVQRQPTPVPETPLPSPAAAREPAPDPSGQPAETSADTHPESAGQPDGTGDKRTTLDRYRRVLQDE